MAKLVYRFTETFPEREEFSLVKQMQRAAVSIPSNIAEGSSRNSQVEYKRFLEMAIGSSFELETQLMLCLDLNYGEKAHGYFLLKEINDLQKMINSLINKIVSCKR